MRKVLGAVGIAYFVLCSCVFGQTGKIDSLEKVVAQAGEDTVKAKSLCRLCRELQKKKRYEEALKRGSEGLALAQKRKDDGGVAECLNNLGVVYDSRGDYGKAAQNFLDALKIRKKIGDKSGVAGCFVNLGVVYYNQGDYGKAAEYYLNALKTYQETDDKSGVATCFNNLGIVYADQEDYGKATEYYLDALKVREQIGDKNGVAACLNNLGVVYDSQGDYDKAIEHYLNALKVREQIGDKNGVAACLNNLGVVYDNQGDYGKAIEHYLGALKTFEEIGDKSGVAGGWANLAEVYLRTGRPAEARSLARKGLALATEIRNMQTMRINALFLALADSAVGDFRSAFENHKLYKAYSDSLRNDEQTKKIARLEARRQYELEAAEQKRQAEIAAAQEAERQERVYMFQSIGIFAFLMLMIVSLFFLGRMKLPAWTLRGLLYVALVMTFEFFVLLFDPLNEKYSEGLPIYKMLFNTALGLGIGPLHGMAERKLTARLVERRASFSKSIDGAPSSKRAEGDG